MVFVYGTLKKGFSHHARYMQQARLVGSFRTRERFRLILNGERYAPCMLEGSGQGCHVLGEVYAVDRAGLEVMDRLERIDRPDGYRRQRILVEGDSDPGNDTREVYVYLKAPGKIDDPRSDPLESYTPELGKLYRKRPPIHFLGEPDNGR